jgi:hypothetical protein
LFPDEGLNGGSFVGLEPGLSPPVRDYPLVDFYNTGIYTGGPYGSPLGYPAYWADHDVPRPHGHTAWHRNGCDEQSQAVRNSYGATTHVTVVRC